MKISKEARRFARELFQASLVNGRLEAKAVAEYSDRLIAEKPRSYVQILREFARLVRLELERRHATVESAEPLAPAEADRIRQELLSRFGDDLTFEFRSNPSLLGGLRVQIGSDVWDGSVANRLHLLKQQL
jgi:F-type H+-transporting ATPase subunit delta